MNKKQRSVLEAFFRVQFYTNKTTRKQLASQTGLSEKIILRWFRHRRRVRRQKEGDQHYLIVRI